MAVDSREVTMPRMAKQKKKVERSPSWKLFVRLNPDLEPLVEKYRTQHVYPPTMSKIIERALRMLLERESKPPRRPDAAE